MSNAKWRKLPLDPKSLDAGEAWLPRAVDQAIMRAHNEHGIGAAPRWFREIRGVPHPFGSIELCYSETPPEDR